MGIKIHTHLINLSFFLKHFTILVYHILYPIPHPPSPATLTP
jgi:hypothetical protein